MIKQKTKKLLQNNHIFRSDNTLHWVSIIISNRIVSSSNGTSEE